MGKKSFSEIVNAIWSGAAVMAKAAGKTANAILIMNALPVTEKALSSKIKWDVQDLIQSDYNVFEAWGTHWTFFVLTTEGINPRVTIKTKTMTELNRINVS